MFFDFCRLLSVSYALLILCTALAIAATVIVDNSIGSFESNLTFLKLVGENAASLLSIHHIAVVHALWLRGWRHSTEDYERTLIQIVGDYSTSYQRNHIRLLDMITSDSRNSQVKDLISGENTAIIGAYLRMIDRVALLGLFHWAPTFLRSHSFAGASFVCRLPRGGHPPHTGFH